MLLKKLFIGILILSTLTTEGAANLPTNVYRYFLDLCSQYNLSGGQSAPLEAILGVSDRKFPLGEDRAYEHPVFLDKPGFKEAILSRTFNRGFSSAALLFNSGAGDSFVLSEDSTGRFNASNAEYIESKGQNLSFLILSSLALLAAAEIRKSFILSRADSSPPCHIV